MFNLIFIFVFTLNALRAFFNGLKNELVSVVSMLFGVLLAIPFHLEYYGLIDRYLGRPVFSKVICFALIVLLALGVGGLFNLGLGAKMKGGVSMLSRAFAVPVSLFKSFLICFCLYVIVRSYLDIFAEDLSESVLNPYFQGFFNLISSFL